jgi:bile acid-coenzyme A ligase
MTEDLTFGRRLTQLAAERGDEVAVHFAADDGSDRPIGWRTFERRANQTARLFQQAGLRPGDIVVVGLPNGPEHVITTFATWKVGASVLPLRADLPVWERDRILGVAKPSLVVGDWREPPPGSLSSEDIRASGSGDDAPLAEDHVPPYTRLLATSGSTGTPKIIVSPSPGIFLPDEGAAASVSGDADACTLCASPLYHNNGFSYCYPVLLKGHQVVLLEHFDARRTVELIERYHVTMTVLVPTMLQRIATLEHVRDYDLSSLQRVVYGGAVLPLWVARAWLELVPPERFVFVYGGSELLGVTMCSGREWLERPGTVGLPVDCDVAILDEQHQPVAPDQVGQIWMRLHSDDEPFEYIGTQTPKPILGGYRSYGDMGWVDADGFLYVADRRQDMIVTGGVNVFPAEVEAALSEHRGLADVVVIGLPDPEWGHRVHAVVQPADPLSPPSDAELLSHCKARLSGPKVPKSFERVDVLPRTTAGKVNRGRLVQERVSGA